VAVSLYVVGGILSVGSIVDLPFLPFTTDYDAQLMVDADGHLHSAFCMAARAVNRKIFTG
jgi:hypothetical protein